MMFRDDVYNLILNVAGISCDGIATSLAMTRHRYLTRVVYISDALKH